MNENINFEEGMEELERLAHALESGEMSLEASFQAYERAAALKKRLQEILDEGDRRIHVLTESGEETMEAEEI